MKALEYLQFVALMIPTVLIVLLAAVSLADPTTEAVGAELPAPSYAVDDAAHQTAY